MDKLGKVQKSQRSPFQQVSYEDLKQGHNISKFEKKEEAQKYLAIHEQSELRKEKALDYGELLRHERNQLKAEYKLYELLPPGEQKEKLERMRQIEGQLDVNKRVDSFRTRVSPRIKIIEGQLQAIHRDIEAKEKELGGLFHRFVSLSAPDRAQLGVELDELYTRKSGLEQSLQSQKELLASLFIRSNESRDLKRPFADIHQDLNQLEQKYDPEWTLNPTDILRGNKFESADLNSYLTESDKVIKVLENSLPVLDAKILKATGWELLLLRQQKSLVKNELSNHRMVRLELRAILDQGKLDKTSKQITLADPQRKAISDLLGREQAKSSLIKKIEEFRKLSEYLDQHIQVDLKIKDTRLKAQQKLEERKQIRQKLDEYLRMAKSSGGALEALKAALADVNTEYDNEAEASAAGRLRRRLRREEYAPSTEVVSEKDRIVTELAQGMEASRQTILALQKELGEITAQEKEAEAQKSSKTPWFWGIRSLWQEKPAELKTAVDRVDELARRKTALTVQIEAERQTIERLIALHVKITAADFTGDLAAMRVELGKFLEPIKAAETRVLQFGSRLSAEAFMPMVSVPINDALEAFNRVGSMAGRLTNGDLDDNKLGDLDLAQYGLEDSERSQAKIKTAQFLGAELETKLKKIAADRLFLGRALKQLNDAKKQAEEAREELNRLRGNFQADTPEAGNLGAAFDELTSFLLPISKNDAGIEMKIKSLNDLINLATRMERTEIIRTVTKRKLEVQKSRNEQQTQLDAITTYKGANTNDPTRDQAAAMGFDPLENVSFAQLTGKANDLETNLATLKTEADVLDRICQQELVGLQLQDADPEKSTLPVLSGMRWAFDQVNGVWQRLPLFNNQVEDLGRPGRESVDGLARAKLLADAGVTVTDAITQLSKKLEEFLNAPAQAKLAEIRKLLMLPKWVLQNPALARELIRNVQISVSLLQRRANDTAASKFFTSVAGGLEADALVKDFLEGTDEVAPDSISIEGVALLHCAQSAPAIVGAFQSAAVGTDAGNWVRQFSAQDSNLVTKGIVAIAATATDLIAGAAVGTAAVETTRAIAKQYPTLGRTIGVIGDSSSVQEGIATYVKREMWADVVSFGRGIVKRIKGDWSIATVGSAISDTVGGWRDNLKSWWDKSSTADKAVRVGTGLAIAGGVAISIATGGLAPAAVAVVLMGAAVAKYVTGHIYDYFWRDTVAQVRQEATMKGLREQLEDPQAYGEFLNTAVKLMPKDRQFKPVPTSVAEVTPAKTLENARISLIAEYSRGLKGDTWELTYESSIAKVGEIVEKLRSSQKQDPLVAKYDEYMKAEQSVAAAAVSAALASRAEQMAIDAEVEEKRIVAAAQAEARARDPFATNLSPEEEVEISGIGSIKGGLSDLKNASKTRQDEFEQTLLKQAVEKKPGEVSGWIKSRIGAFKKDTEKWAVGGYRDHAQGMLAKLELDLQDCNNDPAKLLAVLDRLRILELYHKKTPLMRSIVLNFVSDKEAGVAEMRREQRFKPEFVESETAGLGAAVGAVVSAVMRQPVVDPYEVLMRKLMSKSTASAV